MPPESDVDAPGTGWKIDTGDGPKPATGADVFRSLSQLEAAAQLAEVPSPVRADDDEARALVEAVKDDPETQRLAETMRAEARRAARRPAEPVAPVEASRETARPREHRASASRRTRQGDSGDSDSEPPPIRQPARTAAVLSRLRAHVERRQRRRFEHYRGVVA